MDSGGLPVGLASTLLTELPPKAHCKVPSAVHNVYLFSGSALQNKNKQTNLFSFFDDKHGFLLHVWKPLCDVCWPFVNSSTLTDSAFCYLPLESAEFCSASIHSNSLRSGSIQVFFSASHHWVQP